jgi:glycosyltransferase involved in cell wall biosynthesis
MKQFSLIMPTIGRFTEIECLFDSLAVQTYKNFEVIIVDQNDTNTLETIKEKYEKILSIRYIRSSQKGLSLNRNIGLHNAEGEILGFLDDDCLYKPDALQYVHDFFIHNADYNLFSFNIEDPVSHIKKHKSGPRRPIEFNNFYESGCSVTIFVKKKSPFTFTFDEQLGVGAKYGSGEESDMILYLLTHGYTGIYDGDYSIYHPDKGRNYDCKRAYNYGLGYGALYKKTVFHYKRYFFMKKYLFAVIKNFGAIIISRYKKYYVYALCGKINGFLRYRERVTPHD